MNTVHLFLKKVMCLSEFYKAPDPNLVGDSNRNVLGYLLASCSFLQSYFEEGTVTHQIKPTQSNVSANTRH